MRGDANEMDGPDKLEVATFGGGCFWCVEAVFRQVAGVASVVSGYAGGSVENPTYEQVCTGTTGHAEVCQIRFDPAKVGYEDLLDIFWKTHDPTTPNRQGHDVGPQYRSVIFFHDARQKEIAERRRKELDQSGLFPAPIVTECRPFERFFPAEEYHHDYFARHPQQQYCQYVVRPKVEKFRHLFPDRLTG